MTIPETVLELAEAIRRRHISAEQVIRRSLDRIEAGNKRLNAMVDVFAERSLQVAREIDARLAAGEDPGPLAGVPIAVKDNIVTDAGRSRACSRILENYASPFTATVVQRLTGEGAIVIGRTNCDEFGMGSSNEHSAAGPARNPWDPARVPGGSSGGSAAAVAAGFCAAAIGSDTGGSVRQPAAMCGVVGLKPTYGRVSRFGLIAFASSLDQIGPITRTVADSAAMLRIMAGRDERDATSADHPVEDFLASIDDPVDGLRLGVPRQYEREENEPEVNRATEAAIKTFTDLGAEVVDSDLPLTEYALATYYVLAPAEASSNLARYDGVRYGRRASIGASDELFDLYARSRAEGFGPEVKRRIMLGTYVLSAGYYDQYYAKALKARRLIKDEFDRAFENCHAIIGPTSPVTAFPLGEKTDPMTMYCCDVYTANTNIAGIPGISVPAGFAERGGSRMPIGMHIQSRAFDESTLLRIARMFEEAAPQHHQSPPMLTSGGQPA